MTRKPSEADEKAAEIISDSSEWEIWIDDVCGELAMRKTHLAKRKIEVVDKESFDKAIAALTHHKAQTEGLVAALKFYAECTREAIDYEGCNPDCIGDYNVDTGQRARAALKDYEGKE